MNKTANEGFSNTAKKLKKRGATSLSSSHSQRGISEGQKLFKNNGIIDKISPGEVQGAYGSYDNRKTPTISVNTRNKEHIPYPHLAAFINKHSGGVHFGKRMHINNKQSTNEIFHDQHKQIEDKKHQKELEKTTLKKEEYHEMLQMKEDAIRDDIEREIDTKVKQLEFKREMQQMQEHKRMLAEQEKAIKHTETYDYFPFTHGENIDSMKENYKRVVLSTLRSQHHSQDSLSSKPVSRSKPGAVNMFNRTGLDNPVSNDYTIENSRVKRFRSTQKHPKVLKSALERFENSLLKREKEKLQEEQDFRDQVEHNKAYHTMLQEKKTTEQKRNRETLLRHMNENRQKQLQERLEHQKYVRTNYGPEETDFGYIKQAQKKDLDRAELQRELFKQVNDKNQMKQTNNLGILEEQKDLKINQDIITALKDEHKVQKNENIKSNVEMWDLQQKMKKKAEDL